MGNQSTSKAKLWTLKEKGGEGSIGHDVGMVRGYILNTPYNKIPLPII
jgi:hypothetical protein